MKLDQISVLHKPGCLIEERLRIGSVVKESFHKKSVQVVVVIVVVLKDGTTWRVHWNIHAWLVCTTLAAHVAIIRLTHSVNTNYRYFYLKYEACSSTLTTCATAQIYSPKKTPRTRQLKTLVRGITSVDQLVWGSISHAEWKYLTIGKHV